MKPPPEHMNPTPEFIAQLNYEAPRDSVVSVAAATHPDDNQDQALCSAELGLLAVFDGMGGMDGGALAARAGVAGVMTALRERPDPHAAPAEFLLWASQTARGFCRASQRMAPFAPERDSTYAAALVSGAEVLYNCIGDSRIYLLSDGAVTKLTDDSRFTADPDRAQVWRLLDTAETREEILADPLATQLFVRRNVVADSLASRHAAAAVDRHPVKPGDVVIGCTDGVHDNLTEREIAETANAAISGGPRAVAGALVAAAQERSRDCGHVRAKDDDITCAVLFVGA